MRTIFIIFSCLLFFHSGYSKPHLSFFCELPSKELKQLFEDTSLIQDLVALHAQIRLGIVDFSKERAEVVHQLNEHGIPVIAWLLLPKDKGYWFNLTNGKAAIERYSELKLWTIQKDLKWAGMGIDLEPKLSDVEMIANKNPMFFIKAFGRMLDNDIIKESGEEYKTLIEKIIDDGYPLESYVINFIQDERQAKTTSFQKAVGILDIKTGKEIPMLYSSYLGDNGPGFILEYGKDARGIAIGSTGGGVQIKGMGKPLNWQQFYRDLQLAASLTDDIHIFSLEGCVKQGFLQKLKGLKIPEPSSSFAEERMKVRKFRRRLFYLLKMMDYPVMLLVDIVILLAVNVWILLKVLDMIFKKR